MNENYAYLYFGKPLTSIDEADLMRFFSSERDESDTVEYKSYYEKGQTNHAHKEAAVLKTICAFLNSSGGLLIWGAPVGHKPEGRSVKIFTGELSPVPELIEKDTFISRVANRIRPANNQIRMHRINMAGGGYVYLFDVEQSTFKPHQFDDRYWVRHDGQTGIAPHYLIDALFKQIRYPNLGGYIRFESCVLDKKDPGNLRLRLVIFVLNHSRHQNEYNSYYMLRTYQGHFQVESSSMKLSVMDRVIQRDNMVDILSYTHGPYDPVFLMLPYKQLRDEPTQKIELELNFGGREAPMKRSIYELSFKGFGQLEQFGQEKIRVMFNIEKTLNTVRYDDELSEDERVEVIVGEQ